jgi:uncharacterized membrane protein
MSAIVTNNFRQTNAKNFYDSFSSTAYYLFIGRPEAWADDANPPSASDTISTPGGVYRDMLSAKLLSSSDVSFVIPRKNWVSGTTYDMYSHDVDSVNPTTSGATSLWVDSPWYVMNSSYQVYICISNDSGTASTSEPTGTSTSIVTTADGYKWKFLYTIPTSDVQRFLSLDFMPVKEDSTVAAATTAGSVDHITLVSGGSGYTNGTYTAVALSGDGSSATADVTIASGSVTAVVMNAVGSGYTFASLDLSSQEDSTVTTVSAVTKPIVSPSYGHGANNTSELGAAFVLVNVTLTGTEGSGDFVVSQDFRQLGLLANPKTGGSVSTASTLSCTKSLTLTGYGTTYFTVDEVITGSGSNSIAIVVDFDSSTGVLKYIQQNETGYGVASNGNITAFTTSDTVTGASSTASGAVGTLTGAEIDANSGDVIYIENRQPIPRASDQQENIKLIVEF